MKLFPLAEEFAGVFDADELGLAPELLRAVSDQGDTIPAPIQQVGWESREANPNVGGIRYQPHAGDGPPR
ncbi:hypothetical protein AGMMS50256_25570 [Betaproteobacteria bacterium]|nr:hypothetical protein AGMMS50256_25570 [Betaproteobacteria bacterium]